MQRRVLVLAGLVLAQACGGEEPDGAEGSNLAARPAWVADTQIVRDSLGRELELVIGRRAEHPPAIEPREGARDPDQPGVVRGLAPESAHELMRAARPRWFVIDLRGPEAYVEGHLPGAFLIAPDLLEENVQDFKIRVDQTILVYDEDGRTAREAARLLASYGFPTVRWIEGGFVAWRAAGLPKEGA